MASGPGAELSGTPTSASGGVASALVWCKAGRQQFLWLRCLSRCNWGVSRRVLVWPQGQALNCQGHPPLPSGGVEVALLGAGPGESTSSGCGASPGATGESAGGACKASGPGAELSGTPTSASGGVASALVRCRARRQQFLCLRCLSRCNWGVSRRCLYGLRARR